MGHKLPDVPKTQAARLRMAGDYLTARRGFDAIAEKERDFCGLSVTLLHTRRILEGKLVWDNVRCVLGGPGLEVG